MTRTLPLYVTCQRRGCGRVRQVGKPHLQRRGKYCSRRCANLVNQNIRAAGLTGVYRSVIARRRRVLTRVRGLTPLQAFKLGYVRGLQSKLRQIRKRYQLVRRAA